MSTIEGISRQQLIQQALGQIGSRRSGVRVRLATRDETARATKSSQTLEVRRAAFNTAEQARYHAVVSAGSENPKNLASLKRLNTVLEIGEPLRPDVPRGYYLNLEV